MSLSIPYSIYREHTILGALKIALMSTVSGASAVLTAFVWRDIVVNLLQKYNIFDVNAGFSSTKKIAIGVGVGCAITLIAAAIIAFSARHI